MKGIVGVRLADGSEHLFEVSKPPRAWQSWVMRQLPYGTSFTGCTFIMRRPTN